MNHRPATARNARLRTPPLHDGRMDGAPEPNQESLKARTDRRLMELLGELRVVLPGAQVLLAFLLTVPFATHFDQVSHGGRIVFFICLVLTSLATILLMAPSVYHRLRWEKGGKEDVIRVGHVMFLVGTGTLALGILAAMCLVMEVLFGWIVAGATVGLIGLAIVASWYAVPLTRGRERRIREIE
jgi:Family of unknown function (DUF6328)